MNFPNKLKSYKLQAKKGQLLLEALFAIAVGGIILGVGASLLIAGLQASNISVERDVAQKLLNETFEAVRAVAFENWGEITSLTAGNDYHPELEIDSGESYKWASHSDAWGSSSVAAVSAFSPRNVWIGVSNNIYHYNGNNWTLKNPSTTFTVNDIATVSETEAWAVGDGGHVWEFNNSTWTQHDGALLWGTANINSVSAANSTTVWIGGDSGTVYKYDGTTWTVHSGVTRWGSEQINAVSALSDNVYIADNGGGVWQYDGSSWIDRSGGSWNTSAVNDISLAPLSDDSTSNVWVVAGGDAFKFNGSGWGGFDGGGRWDPKSPTEISAYSEDNVFLAADDRLWNYNGTTWTKFETSNWGLNTINDISDRFSTELWIVGGGGKVFQLKPAKWKLFASTESITLNDTVYTRKFSISNVSRDIDGDIDPAGTDDPSTKKVTATISWSGGSLSSEEYISRWQRDSCFQTDWGGDEDVAVHLDCPTDDYETKSNSLDLFSDGESLRIFDTLISGTASLTSTIFDTGADNPKYRSIYWNGNMGDSNDVVRFQIATSDDASTWTYYGENCVSDTWFTWTGTSEKKDINCSSLDGGRYLKYKVQLCVKADCSSLGSLLDTGPRVDDLLITWTP